MGLFSKMKNTGTTPVWRDNKGIIRCLGDNCPQKKCDETCPIWKQTIAAELMQRGSAIKALEVMESVVDIAPDFYDAWNNMGAVHGQLGSYQNAYDCYLKAHELNADKTQPVFGLALSSRDLKLYEECILWCDLYDKLTDDHRCDAVRSVAVSALEQKTMKGNAMVAGEIVHCDQDEGYSCVKLDERYYFLDKDGDKLCTPGGNVISTLYRKLADRIFSDIVSYGLNDMGSYSVLPWHYTMIDNFAKMGKDRVIQVLEQSFLSQRDWTFLPNDNTWQQVFGIERFREEEIKVWLSKCSIMQMTAACCIGNAYHSINMAFSMAKVLELAPYENKRTAMASFSDLAATGTEKLGLGSPFDVMQDFDTFELYYGIHLEEDGNIIV